MKNVILIVLSLTFIGLTSCSTNSKPERLVIWQTESDENARKVLDKFATEFGKENDVEIDIILNSWGAQADKIIKAINSEALPDIAHVQPFMVKSLVNKNKLVELDAIANELNQKYKFLAAANDIAKFDDHRYGLPYAIGVTSWAYNNELCSENFSSAKTWKDFLNLAIKNKKTNLEFYITLPGASTFFIEQLYCELLANNSGKMFDENGTPLFKSKENIEVLEFLRSLKKNNLLHPNWKSQTYLDQFTQLAKGKTSVVLVTYARASNTIESLLQDSLEKANDKNFLWMNQPTGPSNTNNQSVATVDCEPWVIFKKGEDESSYSKERIKLCNKFLLEFYSKSNYLEFTKTVPIHLTPIFEELAIDSSYLQSTQNWNDWHKHTLKYLNNEQGFTTRPILMPDNSKIGKSWGFLLELQYSKILANAVLKTLSEETPVHEIANEMQLQAEVFLNE